MNTRILVIDDDSGVRDSLTLSLETAGYAVMGAATCQEGLNNHAAFCPSVIISDVVSLQDGEGGESLRQLFNDSPCLPLITLTGNIPSSAESFQGRRQEIRPLCTLQKPFTVDELLETVQRALA